VLQLRVRGALRGTAASASAEYSASPLTEGKEWRRHSQELERDRHRKLQLETPAELATLTACLQPAQLRPRLPVY